MNLLNFSIHGTNEWHRGAAEIINTGEYADLLKEAESAFDNDITIRKIGTIKNEKYALDWHINTYDIYETYEDSGSDDYYYYALLTHSEPV